MIRLFVSILLLTIAFQGKAQEVEIIDFQQLDRWLHRENDTLYVINFWATWCKPCVEEMPHFEQINAKYRHKKVKVILVSLDFESRLDSKVRPFLKKKGIRSKVALFDAPNANEWIDKVSPEWSGSIPATVIYCAPKGFRRFYEQSFTYQQLNDIIKPLIE